MLHKYCEFRDSSLNHKLVSKEVCNERKNQDCIHNAVRNKSYMYNTSKVTIVREIFTNYLKKYL